MGADAPTRVLIADDHPVYIDGIAAAIQRSGDLELVATCRDGAEALDEIRRIEPDVAVLDLRMPRLGAAAVLAELSGTQKRCAVLVLSMHVEGPEVHECLSLGAAGYIAKDADRAEICDAIRNVANGQTVLSSDAATSMAAELQQRRSAEREMLSPREREILEPAGGRRLGARDRRAAVPEHGDHQDAPSQPVSEARRVGSGRGGRRGNAPRPDPLSGPPGQPRSTDRMSETN